MSPRILGQHDRRILRQLRHDRRTIALLLVVPAAAADPALLHVRRRRTDVFDRIALIMLGIFPFVIMFLITSIAMLRERTTGTLERLLTTPLGKLDLLFGYGIAFGARRRGAGRGRRPAWRTGCSTWTPPAAPGWSSLIAVANAVLGVALGLFCSAFARTEFQAVQFMPVVVVPQMLLCGLFVAAGPDGRLAAGDQRRAADDVRGRGAAARSARTPTPTDTMWRDLGDRRRLRWSLALVAGRGDAAPPHRPDGPGRRCVWRRHGRGRRPRQPGHPGGDPGRRPRRRSPSAGFDGASIRRDRRPAPGSTRRWSTTTSAPRTSCSWPR